MIRGSLVLRDEGDGCLLSKYVNTESPPFVEAAKFKQHKEDAGRFFGVYDTIWLERRNGIVTEVRAVLTISRHRVHDENFELVWEINGHVGFRGIGMLFGELLVAGYWSV